MVENAHRPSAALARSRYRDQGTKTDRRRRQPTHERGIEAEELPAFLDGSGDEKEYDAQHHADHGTGTGAGGAQWAEYERQSEQSHDDHGEQPRDPRPVADFI